FAGRSVHGLTIASAPQMSQPGTRNQAASRLARMIDRRQDPPVGPATVNQIVVEPLARYTVVSCLGECYAGLDRKVRKLIHRSGVDKQPEMRLVHKRHSTLVVFPKLSQPRHPKSSGIIQTPRN